MAIVGNHPIHYRIPKDTRLAQLNLDIPLKFEETDFTIVKKFGTDRWTLHIGEILAEMLKEVNAPDGSGSSFIRLRNIKAPKFKKGLFQWSRHFITIELDYDLMLGEKVLKSGQVTGQGNGAGSEFGFLTYIPVAGNENFDRGIEVAVYRCLENCLFQIEKELKNGK